MLTTSNICLAVKRLAAAIVARLSCFQCAGRPGMSPCASHSVARKWNRTAMTVKPPNTNICRTLPAPSTRLPTVVSSLVCGLTRTFWPMICPVGQLRSIKKFLKHYLDDVAYYTCTGPCEGDETWRSPSYEPSALITWSNPPHDSRKGEDDRNGGDGAKRSVLVLVW